MSRIRALSDPDHLPALDPAYAIARPALGVGEDQPPPRILLLYGSLRERSFSRLAVEEAARLLRHLGAETRIFDPSDLPLPDQVAGDDHPAVHQLRKLSMWSEGQVWCSPERHGQISGIMKAQIDHLPLEMKGLRPHPRRDAGVGGLPILQRGQHNAPPWAMDANVHHPQPIVCRHGLQRV